MQIPYFVTLHDLNLLCPNYSFQLPDGRPCGAEQRPEQCQPESCFGGTFASGSAYLRTYRAEINRRLERAKYIFSPSAYIKTTYSKWYVNLTFKNIPHWPPAYEMPDCGLALENEDSSLLRVAIIGAVTPIKGSSLLCEVLDRGIPYVRWYLFGALGDPCVLAFESDNVIIYGAYKRNEIVKLLIQNTIDVVCLLSKTNESYGYTLSEAWLARCPVICTPSGAICERVENSGGGWVVHDADEIVSVLSALHKNRNLIKEQRNNIPDFIVEDRNTAIQQYIDFYITSFSQPVYTPSPQANLALLNAWTMYNQYNVSTQNQPFIIQLAKLYYDDGTGYCEEHHLQALITTENNFSLEFNFPMPTVCRSIRFDIIDGFQTHVRIENATVINSDGTERILDTYVHNGKELAGLIQFETIDPNILWSMPELPIKSVRIQGTWHLVLPSPDQVISAPSITLDSNRSLINRIQCKVFLLLRRIRYKYERALLKRKSKRL